MKPEVSAVSAGKNETGVCGPHEKQNDRGTEKRFPLPTGICYRLILTVSAVQSEAYVRNGGQKLPSVDKSEQGRAEKRKEESRK